MSRKIRRYGTAAAVACLAVAGAMTLSSQSSAAPAGAEITVSAQAGADMADKLDRSLAAWASDPAGAKRTIVLTPNSVIDLSKRDGSLAGQPYQLQDGMRFACLDTIGREFRSGCKIRVQGGTSFFRLKAGNEVRTRDLSFVGIEWDGPASMHWLEPLRPGAYGNGPILAYTDFEGVAWNGFDSVMNARHLGVRMLRIWVNNSNHTPFELSGSDNTYAHWFLDSPNLDPNEYQFYARHLGKSDLEDFYVTCQNVTCLRQDGGQGLRIIGGEWEGRNAGALAAGAPIVVNAGNLTITSAWIAYGGGNVAGTGRSDRGLVQVNAGGDLTISGVEFGANGTPGGFFDVYTAGGTVCHGANRVENGAVPEFGQVRAGLVSACNPTVRVG